MSSLRHRPCEYEKLMPSPVCRLRLLRGNSLTNVRTNTFNGLSSLEFLTLTDNGITFLPDDVFSTSTGLVTL